MNIELNLPNYSFQLKKEGSKTKIFDRLRKRYVVLTPEEWVRQHVVNYLIEEKGFPASLMIVEMGLTYNGLPKRGDIIVHGKKGEPLVIVECKAPQVKITQATFDQIALYNRTLKVKYLMVTNGINHYCCAMNYVNSSYAFLQEIPLYKDLHN